MKTKETTTWVVTELNTRENTYKNDIMDILYGDDYKRHEYETREEAYECADRLKEQGVKTSISKQTKKGLVK